MSDGSDIDSTRLKARVAGACYLLTIAVGIVDHLVIGRWTVALSDPGATAHRLLAVEPLYRFVFALDLLPIYVVVTGLLYGLLKPVDAVVSRIAALASLAGGAVGSAIAVLKIAPLVILQPSDSTVVPSTELRLTLARLALDLHGAGFAISLMFFGCYCLLLGWLIIRADFMPSAVGAAMVAAGVAYMAYSFAYFAWPPLAARLSTATLLLGTIGETALTVWLLACGRRVSVRAPSRPVPVAPGSA